MKKSVILTAVWLILGMSAYGQLNNYKYIVIPTKFQGFTNDNQHRTSTLVKYLFSNQGFNAVYGNNLPDDLKKNSCLGVEVDLIDESNLFATKTQLSLIDCNGVVVFTSQDGRSKSKDYEQAYREAISESFGSFRGLNYKYDPEKEDNNERSETVTLNFSNDVRSLEQEANKTQQPASPLSENNAESEDAKGVKVLTKEKNVLYAQPIEGGFQLVDITPKVVYVLKSTSVPDVFLVQSNGKNGVVFKNNDQWFIELDEKGSKAKPLNIRF